MGKPKNGPDPAFSLQVVADRLSELLGQPVKMASDVVGESAQSLAASLKDGEVMLLENTRFEKGETKNDPELSKKLAVILTERIKVELTTCRDVVATGRYPYTGRLGVLRGEDQRIVDEAMETVHALELAERDFNAISDGQRQRVLLARAISSRR